MQESAYDAAMYEAMADTAASAAVSILPLLFEHFRPRSVIDYGCGTGSWLRAFREQGVETLLGVDGPWIDRDLLTIPLTEFRVHDLNRLFETERRFDLAVCLEVVEHIRTEHEGTFIDSLARLAPVILFSAPIPHQPGVGPGPFNNRWPAYWAAEFARRGFVWVDCLRPRIWEDSRVAWYYAQNVGLVVREDRLAELPSLQRERQEGDDTPLPLVHPRLLDWYAGEASLKRRAPRELSRALLGALKRSALRR